MTYISNSTAFMTLLFFPMGSILTIKTKHIHFFTIEEKQMPLYKITLSNVYKLNVSE